MNPLLLVLLQISSRGTGQVAGKEEGEKLRDVRTLSQCGLKVTQENL